MMRAARKELGLATDETAILGDTMETDILGGVQLGYHTVLVLSGGTRREDLPRYAYRPEVVVDDLSAFADLLEETDWRPPWRSADVWSEQRPLLLARSEGGEARRPKPR
jgi:NagD protein